MNWIISPFITHALPGMRERLYFYLGPFKIPLWQEYKNLTLAKSFTDICMQDTLNGPT
jgi:hypothetical protein